MQQCDLQNHAMKWFMPSIVSFHFKETLFDRVYHILTGRVLSNFKLCFCLSFWCRIKCNPLPCRFLNWRPQTRKTETMLSLSDKM